MPKQVIWVSKGELEAFERLRKRVKDMNERIENGTLFFGLKEPERKTMSEIDLRVWEPEEQEKQLVYLRLEQTDENVVSLVACRKDGKFRTRILFINRGHLFRVKNQQAWLGFSLDGEGRIAEGSEASFTDETLPLG